MSDESLKRADRLRRRADFVRCYRQGRRRHGAFMVLHFAPNPTGSARLGITASRKVGNAVVRHLVKRRIREVFRRWSGRSRLPSLDLVVHCKPGIGRATFPETEVELKRLLSSLAGDTSARSGGSS